MFRGYAKCGCPIWDEGVRHDPSTCTNLDRNRVPAPARPALPVCKACHWPYDARAGYTACPRCGEPLGGEA